MSKKNALSPRVVKNIIDNYLHALVAGYGDNHADQTELTYRKGYFYIRPPGISPTVVLIPRTKKEIEALTLDLRVTAGLREGCWPK